MCTYLLNLLGFTEGTEGLAPLSPDAVRKGTMEALRRIALAARPGRPTVIVIEDLQWIDRTSEEALSLLADGLAHSPILLVVTYRPDYQSPWLDRLHASQLALQGLSRADSLAVVQSLVPKQHLSSDLEQTILARLKASHSSWRSSPGLSQDPDLRSRSARCRDGQDLLDGQT
jgi:predicted ATPase